MGEVSKLTDPVSLHVRVEREEHEALEQMRFIEKKSIGLIVREAIVNHINRAARRTLGKEKAGK